MKVLVTGATGHLGKHIVKALLQKNYSVRVLVRNAEDAKEAFSDEPIEIFELDLVEAEQPAFDTVLNGVQAVVHTAAVGVVENVSDDLVRKVNVEATRKLVSACKKTSGFERFVFISSSALFHSPPYLPIDEVQVPSPGNSYGKSKWEAEKVIKQSGVPFVILRPVVIYGLGFEDSFMPIVKAVKKGKMKLVGNGENRFPAVHVSDVVEAILLALEKKEAIGEDFNIGGETLTQKQGLEAVADDLGVEAPKKRVSVRMALFLAALAELKAKIFGGKPFFTRDNVRMLSDDRVFSTKKAERILGWKAKVSARDGLNELVSSVLSKIEKK